VSRTPSSSTSAFPPSLSSSGFPPFLIPCFTDLSHPFFSDRPNGSGQANVDATSACQLWREQFAQLRDQGIRLGSAAPDSAPSGKQWLIDFNNVCPDAQPDFCSLPLSILLSPTKEAERLTQKVVRADVLHWYDVKAEDFQKYVLDFATTFGKPIWVTEYACQNFNGGAQCSSDYM
jgi:hypothetical protein